MADIIFTRNELRQNSRVLMRQLKQQLVYLSEMATEHQFDKLRLRLGVENIEVNND